MATWPSPFTFLYRSNYKLLFCSSDTNSTRYLETRSRVRQEKSRRKLFKASRDARAFISGALFVFRRRHKRTKIVRLLRSITSVFLYSIVCFEKAPKSYIKATGNKTKTSRTRRAPSLGLLHFYLARISLEPVRTFDESLPFSCIWSSRVTHRNDRRTYSGRLCVAETGYICTFVCGSFY